ncbi:MAG: hypothetical protein RIS99_584 [Bacteroidota bacterium]
MVYFWVNLVGLKKSAIFAPHSWRRVRVAEGARLESVYTPKAYREFESLRLRNLIENLASPGFFIGDGWRRESEVAFGTGTTLRSIPITSNMIADP